MNRLANERGQMLLISLLILIVLGLSITAVVYMNQTGTRATLAVQKRSQALGTAQEGMEYAMHVLATSTTTWQNALAGNCPAEFVEANGPHVYSDTAGGIFTIRCSVGGTLQNFEVQVVVQAGSLNPATGQPTYNRALQAVLSQKTLAVGLPTETQAGAALVMMKNPQITSLNGLRTDWGPMVSYDSSLWTVSGPIDAQQFPRKFSVGQITGTSFLRSLDPANPNQTDQQEYWATSSLGFPALIDLASYQNVAQNQTTGVTAPVCTAPGNCAASPSGSGYFPGVGNDTAKFQGGWTAPASNAVIYVNGNVDLEAVAIDLKNTGALIVNGNLTLGDPSTDSIPSTGLRVPITAASEYFYHPTQCPCSTQVGQTCTIAQATGGASNALPYRGFLYVTGNLLVSANRTWFLDGVVRVDGQIQVANNATLNILYDDQINRSILVTPIQLMIDSISTIPLS